MKKKIVTWNDLPSTTPFIILEYYNLTAGSEGSELSERLLARAAHTDEQRMASINAEYSMHPGQMFQSVIKQYQVHPRFALIVFLQNVLHNPKTQRSFNMLKYRIYVIEQMTKTTYSQYSHV